jgi:sterol desaturase/sphingolipid hydroxylase (fatty acid hydroxylase superfamily)
MKQLFYFATVNTFLIFLTIITYYATIINNNYLYLYFVYLCKTFTLLQITYYSQNKKKYITPRNNNFNINAILNVFSSVFIETITNIFILNHYNFANRSIMYDILLFVPMSFLFEIIYDFIHYWIHRIFHENAFLYKNIHKKHHKKQLVTCLDTYYQNPIDIILSNSIPLCLTLFMFNSISYFQFVMLSIYKTAVEIAGHTGKETFPTSSFPQFPWLVKYFNIELYTENHDSHHRFINCNYSKRLSLWDKIFGTFKP